MVPQFHLPLNESDRKTGRRIRMTWDRNIHVIPKPGWYRAFLGFNLNRKTCNMPEKEIAARANEILATWGIAAIWWIAHYFYRYSKGAPFQFTMFLVNMFLAWFVGTVVWPLFEPWKMQYACISISGFSSMYILWFLEHQWWKILINFFLRALKLPELPMDKKN